MRLIFILIAALSLLMTACGGGKPVRVSSPEDVDTVGVDTLVVDSLDEEIVDAPMPRAADELFDDFIFNFSANRKLQMDRIVFPLKKINGDRVEMIKRGEWKMEYYFMRQHYYTLLFDSERDMEVVKDTSVNHAVVEMIYFNTGAIIQHIFDRQHGVWMLTAIRTIPISQSENSSFLAFYHRFAADEEFQQESLSESIQFVGPDPDDDFAQMEGVITPDTWGAFAPELPVKMIYNIVYGHPRKEGQHKIFVLRGIANGMEVEMTFRRTNDQWKLTKLST